MNVTELSNEGLKRSYSVVVPATALAAQKDKKLAELGRDLKVPGFRPGKVPASLVASRYGKAVTGEVLDASIQEATDKLLTERSLRPATQPKIDLKEFKDGEDLTFEISLEVLPEITMPDFGAISLTRLKATPGEAEVAKAIENITRRNASLEETESRAAAKGEVLIVDFEGKIDGVAFQGGAGTAMPVEIAGPGFIPGFSEQMEGMVPGETRVITVPFPEDYQAKDLAGKTAEFTITAKTLKVYTKPAVDDELAKKLGLESLEKLNETINNVLQNEYDGIARSKVKRALLDALAEQASFEVPEGLVEAEFGQIWPRVEADLKADRLDADDKGKDEATLRADYRKIAERRIRLGLLLAEIGRTNNIQVTPEELNRAMMAEAQRYPGQERQVIEFFTKNPDAINNLRSPIFEEKVVDFMLELAKVEEKAVTPEELAAAE